MSKIAPTPKERIERKAKLRKAILSGKVNPGNAPGPKRNPHGQPLRK